MYVRERELYIATLDGNPRRALAMLNPMRDQIRARTGGTKGRNMWPRLVEKKIAVRIKPPCHTSWENKSESDDDKKNGPNVFHFRRRGSKKINMHGWVSKFPKKKWSCFIRLNGGVAFFFPRNQRHIGECKILNPFRFFCHPFFAEKMVGNRDSEGLDVLCFPCKIGWAGLWIVDGFRGIRVFGFVPWFLSLRKICRER